MESKWDWIGIVLIAITIFEFWRLNHEDKKRGINTSFSIREFFEDPYVIFLILLGLIVYLMGIVEFRILLVSGIAIYCGIRYFKREKEDIQKKKMGFFAKLFEYACLVLLSLIIGFVVFVIAVPDMERYERKQMVKEIQQQQTQKTRPVTNPYQR